MQELNIIYLGMAEFHQHLNLHGNVTQKGVQSLCECVISNLL